MSSEVIAAFTGLGLTALTTLVLTMRGLAKIENNLREYFDSKLKDERTALRLEIDASRSMFGESVKAVKEHANQAHFKYDELMIKHQNLELYIRDKYVEIDSFNTALNRLEKTVDGIDEKVDTLMSRNNGRQG